MRYVLFAVGVYPLDSIASGSVDSLLIDVMNIGATINAEFLILVTKLPLKGSTPLALCAAITMCASPMSVGMNLNTADTPNAIG